MSPAVTAAQSLRSPLAKPRSSLTGLASAWAAQASRRSPWRWQSMSGELADQVTGGGEFLAAGGDLRERGAVVVGELAGRGEDPAGYLLRRGRWRRRGDGGVLAQPGGEPAQGAQAAR